ncbi:MAG: hypothetical protein ACYDGY_01110 [Acidimicrobiales bacterium]
MVRIDGISACNLRQAIRRAAKRGTGLPVTPAQARAMNMGDGVIPGATRRPGYDLSESEAEWPMGTRGDDQHG